MVSVTVTVPFRDCGTSTLVNVAWSVANATSVKLPNTFVDIVTDAIGIGISCTITSAIANDVELVSVAVTISFWNVGTSTWIDGAWSVANATSIDKAYTVFHIIADAVVVDILCACATTDTNDVLLVAIAVAVSLWDVRTSTLVDVSGSVADAASVELTDAFVNVVTDAVGIGVLRTVAPTDAHGIELVAVAVAFSLWDVRTSTLVVRARTSTNAAGIEDQARSVV